MGLGFEFWPVMCTGHRQLRHSEPAVGVLQSAAVAPRANMAVSFLEGCVAPSFPLPSKNSKTTLFNKCVEGRAVDLVMDAERATMLPIDQEVIH